MASKFHLFASILAGALVCPLAGAQMRNGGASFRQAPVHIGRASGAAGSLPSRAPTGSQSRLQPRVVQISPSGQVTSEFGPIVNTTDFNGVPGLGFDFPHLAAISAGLRNNRFSHFGRGRRGQGTFAPIWYGGYPYYYDDSGYDQPEQQIVQPSQQQPQIIVIQQPVPAQQGADSVNDPGNLSASYGRASSGRAHPGCGRLHFCPAGRARSVRVRVLGCWRAIAVRHPGRNSPNARSV